MPSSESGIIHTAHAKLVKHQIALLRDVGVTIDAKVNLLDFGCGAGDLVMAYRDAGFSAFGCDITLPEPKSTRLETYRREGIIRHIPLQPYRIPFDDNTFDIVVSNQVFEHIMDYDTVIREVRRVTKPHGVGLHIFPSRYSWCERHVYVPLATIFRNYQWLWLWAALGVRNEYQVGLSAAEVACRNREYLSHHTNYLTRSAIRRYFKKYFSSCSFVEDKYLKCYRRFSRVYKRLSLLMPLMGWLYSTFRGRVVLVKP